MGNHAKLYLGSGEMARDFALSFYRGQPWRRTRDAYMRLGHGLCEECLKEGVYTPAVIVHHKIHLSPENIDDPDITLSFDNLERVCNLCHAKLHPEIYDMDDDTMGTEFDQDGNVLRDRRDAFREQT